MRPLLLIALAWPCIGVATAQDKPDFASICEGFGRMRNTEAGAKCIKNLEVRWEHELASQLEITEPVKCLSALESANAECAGNEGVNDLLKPAK